MTRVYPRACGGTIIAEMDEKNKAGLSPRVRGNHSESRANWVLTRVYPRACGGTAPGLPGPPGGPGLSPRVRGNLGLRVPKTSNERSIPARAGEPFPKNVFLNIMRVYPRACGGTTPRYTAGPWYQGLSPRVRGNLHQQVPTLYQMGSIPARAGEPPRTPLPEPSPRVYPRACGGTHSRCCRAPQLQGLSPRVRGNPS